MFMLKNTPKLRDHIILLKAILSLLYLLDNLFISIWTVLSNKLCSLAFAFSTEDCMRIPVHYDDE